MAKGVYGKEIHQSMLVLAVCPGIEAAATNYQHDTDGPACVDYIPANTPGWGVAPEPTLCGRVAA